MQRVAFCLSVVFGLSLGGGLPAAHPQDVEDPGGPYAVALTCDARTATLEARLVFDPEEIEELTRGDAQADPMRVTVLDEGGFELFNTDVIRRFGEAAQVSRLADETADLVAIVSQPTRIFCSAQDGEFWSTGEMIITRSPGNLNPMGRCGATELLTATVTHKGAEPNEISMVGDCHYGDPIVTRVVLDLKSGNISTEGMTE